MLNITIRDNGKTWKQISKTEARKIYDAGSSVMICAANMRPGFPYHPEAVANKEELQRLNFNDPNTFDKFVATYSYYNCINTETGKYCRYYKEA